MSNIPLRIKELINVKNYTVASFEKEIGVGNNSIGISIRRNSNVSGEIIYKILTKFPDVNAQWLVTGKGEMLLNSITTNENELSRDLKALEEIVAILREKNSMQDDIIAMLREKLQFTEDKLQQCQQEKNISKVIK